MLKIARYISVCSFVVVSGIVSLKHGFEDGNYPLVAFGVSAVFVLIIIRKIYLEGNRSSVV